MFTNTSFFLLMGGKSNLYADPLRVIILLFASLQSIKSEACQPMATPVVVVADVGQSA